MEEVSSLCMPPSAPAAAEAAAIAEETSPEAASGQHGLNLLPRSSARATDV